MSQPGVADPNLPGKVADPNAIDIPDDKDPMEQFGQELDKPETDAASKGSDPNDQKRYEYHQSRADKLAGELEKVKKELEARQGFDPLIDVLRKDEEAYRFLQNRLMAPRETNSAPKPPEMPQRPDSYNEVEAYSMPDSASFKYRKSMETYRDDVMTHLARQNAYLLQQREEEMARFQQAQAERERLRKYRDEVVGKGLSAEEFEDFFTATQQATTDDLVEYYKWKKAQSGTSSSPLDSIPPPGRSAGSPRPSGKGPQDIGSVLLAASRRM